MGNLLCSRIFIKSAVDSTNVKFGVMITWVNIIVKKNSLPQQQALISGHNFAMGLISGHNFAKGL